MSARVEATKGLTHSFDTEEIPEERSADVPSNENEIVLPSELLETDTVSEGVDEASTVRDENVNGHPLGTHVLGHDPVKREDAFKRHENVGRHTQHSTKLEEECR